MATVTESTVIADTSGVPPYSPSGVHCLMTGSAQLRHNSPYWWTRWVLTDTSITTIPGQLGTIKVQVRERAYGEPWAAWVTKRSKTVLHSDTTVWTDETYNPPNSTSTMERQIRAVFTCTCCSPDYSWATPAHSL